MSSRKVKILYVVSRLKKSGPTSQLFYLCKNLSSDHDLKVLTLSEEKKGTDFQRFKNADIECECLNLKNSKDLISSGRSKLRKLISSYSPTIIHSQGIRPDIILKTIKLPCPHVITARNFPFEDYIPKYGPIVGLMMSIAHLSVFALSKNLICCSKTLRGKFLKLGIGSKVVSNGTDIEKYRLSEQGSREGKRGVIAVVGELNKRKNVIEIINCHIDYGLNEEFELRIFGSGPLYEKYQSQYSEYEGITFYGHSKNIVDELQKCTCMVSCSKSEGYPNSVLEGLCLGLPVYLSDIPAHREIKEELPQYTLIYNNVRELSKVLSDHHNEFDVKEKQKISRESRSIFDSRITAQKYLTTYNKTLN